MKFTDELNTISEKEKTRSAQAIKQHIMENDFVESLVTAIMEACRKRAKGGEHSLGFVLHRGCDSDIYYIYHGEYRKGEHALCAGAFYIGGNIHSIDRSAYESLNLRLCDIHNLEDDDYIVSKLKSKLNSLGFNRVKVELTYEDKTDTKRQWKHTFWGGLKEVTEYKTILKYYKRLLIELNW